MKRVRPARAVSPGYLAAFEQVVHQFQVIAQTMPPEALPLAMYVAGGAAHHLYTGERVSGDIDAALSRRVLPGELREFVYRDEQGASRHLYFDTQYNESFALLHEEAHADSIPLRLPGIDPALLDVRLLSPTDLAVSKLARFAEHDRADIVSLARAGLITPEGVRRRAEEALSGMVVGSMTGLQVSLDLAIRDIASNLPARRPGGSKQT